jgi:glycerol-3-phosphate acyltransferase PlsY
VLLHNMMILQLLGIFILAYALGNFSPAYLCSRICGGFDIRERGSGNAGATNVVRVMGWRYGALVFILDALKGFAAVSLGSWLGGSAGIAAAAIGVVVGHDLPAVLNFRGGKGVASTAGILLTLFPVPTLIGIAIFILLVALFRMVSLGSLVFVTSLALYSLISGQPFAMVVAAIGLAAFAIVRHRSNIKRIFNGTENMLSY